METAAEPMDLQRPLMSPGALARLLGVPVQSVYGWRTRGGGPPGYRVGRHLRYRPDEVEAWLAERRVVEGSAQRR